MKTKHLFLCMAGLALFVACDQKGGTETLPKLEVDPPTIEAKAVADTYTFDVTSNVEWTAVVGVGAEWLTIDTASGEGDKTVIVAIEENTDLAPRNATITFATVAGEDTKSLTKEIAVKQAGATPPVAHELEVDPPTIEAKAVADTYTFDVTSNVEWIAVVGVGAEWLAIDTASGSGNGTVSITVEANETSEVRPATITVVTVAKAEEATLTKEVTVRQATLATPEHAKTTKFWIVGTGDKKQIWSDAIDMPECNKTDFAGDTAVGVASVSDCRNNTGEYGYLYTMKYIIDNADEMCPDGWRVPGSDDFATLDKNLGGTGTDHADMAVAARYVGSEWGGTFGGYAFKVYNDLGRIPGVGTEGHYRGLPEEGGVEMSLKFIAGGVAFDRLGYNTPYGMQVRCVK